MFDFNVNVLECLLLQLSLVYGQLLRYHSDDSHDQGIWDQTDIEMYTLFLLKP